MFFEIKEANYLDEYKVKLKFEDNSIGIVDFSEYSKKGRIFEKFQDMNYFKNFHVNYGTLIWGDGELDIAPETLYEKATGKTFTYESMTKSV